MTTPADHPLLEGEEKKEDLGSSGDTDVALVGHGGVVGLSSSYDHHVMTLDEARLESLSVEDRRADLIRSAARGQGPTFIAAKLDLLIGAFSERDCFVRCSKCGGRVR